MEVANHHRDWNADLKTGEDCVFVSPRDHGKSQSLARAYPIWKAKYDPWIKEILILGPDQPSAAENLEKLKEMLSKYRSLSYLIPNDRRAHYNSKTEIKLSNGVVLRAKGFWSPLRGRHPQLIVLDDVLNEQNSWSKENRADLKKRFWEVIYPMRDKGMRGAQQKGYKPQLVISGTSQDPDDLYSELLVAKTAFKGRKQKAVIDDDKQVVLWPERYSYDALMKIKSAAGAATFMKEYQNEPMTEDSVMFPPSLFEPLKDRDLSYVNSYAGTNAVYMGVDFSVPGNTTGDWMVIWVMEYLEVENKFIPLTYWRQKPLTTNAQIEAIVDHCKRYNVTIGFLEDNMFQSLYAKHFTTKTTLPLKGNTVTHSGKNSLSTGIMSFRPLFENGIVPLPYKTDRDRLMTDHLIQEFNGIKKVGSKIGNFSFHDDTVLAFWHALEASRTIKFEADFGMSTEQAAPDSHHGIPLALGGF